MTTEYVNSAVDLSAEFVDVLDLIARAEELESDALDLLNGEDGELSELDTDTTAEQLVAAGMGADDAAEMVMLRDILEDLRGGGGDHHWRGDWYPQTLIREDQFEGYMDEMLEDIGDLPKDLPCYLKITVDYDALRMDYTEVEIGDHTYLYR